jgi:hypothetical protein
MNKLLIPSQSDREFGCNGRPTFLALENSFLGRRIVGSFANKYDVGSPLTV